MTPILVIEGLDGGYGALAAFRDARLALSEADTLGILGPNGAGKTTLLKTIAGLLPAMSGSVAFAGHDITRVAANRRARLGLALVPEGRQIIGGLTVGENLDLAHAAGRLAGVAFTRRRDEMLALFPRLRERLRQPGRFLSGGEQQMLAIARAMLLDPAVLMLDEPTQGLAPVMVTQVAAALQTLKQRIPMLIVEQNRAFLETVASRIVTMEGGRIKAHGQEKHHEAA